MVCLIFPHLLRSYFRGKYGKTKKHVFPRWFFRMLQSKCYFLRKNKRIKGKQKRQQRHPRCKQSSVPVSQQSTALHLPRVLFDGGHLKTNKSILLFVHSCAPLRWAGFLCVLVYCSLCPLKHPLLLDSLLCMSSSVFLRLLSMNSSIYMLCNPVHPIKQYFCNCFT